MKDYVDSSDNPVPKYLILENDRRNHAKLHDDSSLRKWQSSLV